MTTHPLSGIAALVEQYPVTTNLVVAVVSFVGGYLTSLKLAHRTEFNAAAIELGDALRKHRLHAGPRMHVELPAARLQLLNACHCLRRSRLRRLLAEYDEAGNDYAEPNALGERMYRDEARVARAIDALLQDVNKLR